MKKTMQAYLLYKPSSQEFDVWSFEPSISSTSNYIVIDSKEVEFDMPDNFDPRPLQIKALQEKQSKAAAAFHAMNIEIMRQINELQALEMTA